MPLHGSGSLEMPSISECPTGVVLAATEGCRQPETIAVSSWQLVARRANRNFCAIIEGVTGRKLFFKHNLGGNLKYIVTDSERRRRDICNILASRIMTKMCGLHSIIYLDCCLLFSDGCQLRGVACDYIDELRWLQTVRPGDVINHGDALCQIVVLTWLGDIDRLKNPSNDFVNLDGLYGTLDFDFCFNDGVSFLGLPIANRCALKYFTSTGSVESTIMTIVNLTDMDIAKMVGSIGNEWVPDWSDKYQVFFVGVLIRNRERLRTSGALRDFGANKSVWLRLLDDFLVKFYDKLIISRKFPSIVRYQGVRETILELRKHVTLWPNRNDRVNLSRKFP
jgi:hypothetical protein